MLELEKEAILRDLDVQVYVKNPENKEDPILIKGTNSEKKTVLKKKKDEEIIAQNYDLKSLAKNGNLVFAKLRLNG